MRTLVVALVAACAALAVGFVAGRSAADVNRSPATSAAASPASPGSPASPATAPAVSPESRTAAPARTNSVDDGGVRDVGHASASASPGAGAGTCVEQLRALQESTRVDDEVRVAKEGTPIAKPVASAAPRFRQEALSSAVVDAFPQTKVPGRMEGIDCSEFPCIAFGRINGTEDEFEKLEDAKSFAPYEDDISSILSWTETDEEAREAKSDQKRPEQALFAIAFYTKDDRDALGDNLDRRIRSRTADLWNTMSPADETAAHR